MATQQAPYRAALIGLGFIGAGDQIAGDEIGQVVANLDGTHFDAISNHPRVELVAAADTKEDRRERFAKRTGLEIDADWRETLARTAPDIVCIATNSPPHAEIAIGCAQAGVQAVYCEKPLATRIVDAEAMIAACREAGTLLVINHNRRFNPNYRDLRDRIAAGELGELTSCNLRWGSGRLGNIATHLFDATEMLTGRKIEAVSGTLDQSGKPDCRGPAYRDPGGWGLLRLSGDLMATVDAADYGRSPASIVINGTKARAETGGADYTIYRPDGTSESSPAKNDEPRKTSMDNAMSEIVAALDAGSPEIYDPTNAARVFEAIIGFHVSHERNAAWVELPIDGVDREREIRIG